VYGFTQDGSGNHGIVMEWIPQTFNDILEKSNKRNLHAIIMDIAEGMTWIHDQNYLHRYQLDDEFSDQIGILNLQTYW
jgi:hypothetical protein